MKKRIIFVCLVLLLLGTGLWIALTAARQAAERELAAQLPAVQTLPDRETLPSQTTIPASQATELPTEIPAEAPTKPPELLTFTEEEEQLLLKIGMAERGNTGCTECIALVMRTVLNRVEGPKFSSTVKGVIYAQDQFTPVAEGTFESAVPNDRCYAALDLIKQGWDESGGALYYEWCEGESWHSRNLNLLLQHCDTRFYN